MDGHCTCVATRVVSQATLPELEKCRRVGAGGGVGWFEFVSKNRVSPRSMDDASGRRQSALRRRLNKRLESAEWRHRSADAQLMRATQIVFPSISGC